MSEHEGMMTRREVLEKLCEEWVKREKLPMKSTLRPIAAGWGQAFVYMLRTNHLWMPVAVRQYAHELALLMDAEREEASSGEVRYVAAECDEHPDSVARRIIAYIDAQELVTVRQIAAQFHWPKPHAEYVVRTLLEQGYIAEREEER